MGPLHISAETETSNLVCYLGLGISLPKKTFTTKLSGFRARGASPKLGPLLISATVEASNFKFGTQLEFGE